MPVLMEKCIKYKPRAYIILRPLFTRYGSVLFRNEMKLLYWLEVTLVRKFNNRTASFHFGTIRNRHVGA